MNRQSMAQNIDRPGGAGIRRILSHAPILCNQLRVYLIINSLDYHEVFEQVKQIAVLM